MSGLHNDTNHLLRALFGDFVLAAIGSNGRFEMSVMENENSLDLKTYRMQATQDASCTDLLQHRLIAIHFEINKFSVLSID